MIVYNPKFYESSFICVYFSAISLFRFRELALTLINEKAVLFTRILRKKQSLTKYSVSAQEIRTKRRSLN